MDIEDRIFRLEFTLDRLFGLMELIPENEKLKGYLWYERQNFQKHMMEIREQEQGAKDEFAKEKPSV